ncbi:hypothetical protein HQ312_17295 [Rhodococcus sp. BP-316]|uniref:DUF6992 family protein n=1 Tax=unclassified Rhodococcus (in: high G+C Gram-positive bacteria) TaxID=192944 RepID=UPI000A4AC70B|nr:MULTISPECIES: hypothetical protein [unclassified Rhodococcus (in: high G+C Gram-positive bacteria)]MBY6682812.1 hypothetical protein [Rhodococcus sp. BP-316]
MTSAHSVAKDLGRRLLWWGGGSVAVGAAAALGGGSPAVRAFGIQTAGWGAIDLAIAGIGAARSTEVAADKMRKTLWINTGLDVVYVALGAHLLYHRPTFGGRVTPQQSSGHGAAVVVQGAALLVLDSVHAKRL